MAAYRAPGLFNDRSGLRDLRAPISIRLCDPASELAGRDSKIPYSDLPLWCGSFKRNKQRNLKLFSMLDIY